jgi:hypothetical protein
MTTHPPDTPDASKFEKKCLSDLTFDRLLGDDLTAAEATAARRHVESCDRCRQRIEALRQFGDDAQAALPGFDELTARRVVAALRRWPAVVGAVLAAAAALILWARVPKPSPGVDETQRKGSGRLGFYVRRGDVITHGAAGEVLHPGDAIEFTYRAPGGGFVGVFSVDGAGHASVYYPTERRAAPFERGERVLPQSTILDDVLGDEVIHALFCTTPILLEPIRAELEKTQGAPAAPAGCRVDSLHIEKRAL